MVEAARNDIGESVPVWRSKRGRADVDGVRARPLLPDPPLRDGRVPVKAPHSEATAYSWDCFRRRFPNAEVGLDMSIIFGERGRRRRSRLSPDVFVALAAPRRRTRADYDVDRLGPPDFVLEVMSRSTRLRDPGRKLDAYQRMGVRECLLFDVTGEDLTGTGKDLLGYALTPKTRKPLDEVELPNARIGVRSVVLGLIAHVVERLPPAGPGETWNLVMRWRDAATGRDIPPEADAANAERRQLRAAVERVDAAERRNARLEDEIRRLRRALADSNKP